MEPRTASAHLSWRVQNLSKDEADIDIFDVIGDPWEGTTAKDFATQLRDLKDVSKLNLHIKSPGGYVSDGLAMYAAIQQHPAEVTAYIYEAASAATFVAMAADTVVIFKNSKMFIHDAHGFGMGNASDFRTLADMLDEESQNIASIYADRTGKTADEWREAMQANNGVGTSYRGQEAVDAGLADEVMEPPKKSRNIEPMRAVALDEPKDEPIIDVALIPPLDKGYEPPLPDDFSRLIAANITRKETNNG